MSGLFLKAGEVLLGLAVGGGVYGAGGIEVVGYVPGVTGIVVDQNVEEVRFGEPRRAYAFQQQGNQLLIFSGAQQVARIVLQEDRDGTLITFADGTLEAKVSTKGMFVGSQSIPAGTPARLR